MFELLKLASTLNQAPSGGVDLGSISEADIDEMLADAKAMILALQRGHDATATAIAERRGLGPVMPLINLWVMRWRDQ